MMNYDLSDLAPQTSKQAGSLPNNYDLSDLAPKPISQVNNSPSLLDSAASTLGNYFSGAGAGLANTLTSGLNLIPRAVTGAYNLGTGSQDKPWLIPSVTNPNPSTAYKVGNVLGNIGGFLGGGEILDMGRLAAEGAPYLGQTAQFLGNSGFIPSVARRALGGAVAGAAQNPNDMSGGATSNAVTSAALDSVGAGAGSLNDLITRNLRPQAYAEQIMGGIRGGRGYEENSQSLAQDIKNQFETQQANASELYNPISQQYGDSNIYQHLNPNGLSGLKTNTQVLQDISPDTVPYYKNFLQNPTFDNAHDLQSQMGADIRRYDVPNPDKATGDTITRLTNYRNGLLSDMKGFLGAQNPDAATAYNNAADYYFKNVVPYKVTPGISQIASGNNTNPTSTQLTSIFKNPKSNIQTIMSHLGTNANNKVIYSQFGKINPSKVSPSSVIDKFSGLDKEGFKSYVPDSLADQISKLGTTAKISSSLQHGAGIAAGWLAGSHLGNPEGAEFLGAAAGNYLMPALLKTSRALVSRPVGNSISTLSPYIRPALLGNNVPSILSGANNGN